jgi:hypothetical protein
MNSLGYLAQVRDLTGKIIHLGMFEEVYGFCATPDKIMLGIDRAKVRETFGRQDVYRRGKTMLTFERNTEGRWVETDRIEVWFPADETFITRERRGSCV